MNLILFTEDEKLGYLNITDSRTIHILNIIKPKVGDVLDMGILNGNKGAMTITEIDDSGIKFTYILDKKSPSLHPITFIIGTPRPPVAKRLLKDLSTSGVKKIIMCGTDLGEKTYLTSKLWKDEKYNEYVMDGGIQGESTIIPTVEKYFSLKKAIESLDGEYDKLAMDNISPDFMISNYKPLKKQVVIVIGGERGLSDRERDLLKDFDFKIFKMGDRILRTETACHHVLGAILSIRGLI